jgi:hypothetical protein
VASADCTDTNTCFGTGALGLNETGDNNSAFGYQALASSTQSSDNTAFGAFALTKHDDFGGGCDQFFCEGSNTAVGYQALASDLSGSGNTATGFQALAFNKSGNYNVAQGVASLKLNTTGSLNTAVGAFALNVNTTGGANTAIGFDALGANQGDASRNTAVGQFALKGFNWDGADRYRQLGDDNTAIGKSAMMENDTGNNNTAIGSDALRGSGNDGMTGSNNTASGALALLRNTTGDGNTATGYTALQFNASGFRNSAMGVNALGGVTTGARNTAVGFGAGKNIVSGSDNIAIGANTVGAASENGVIRIGTSAFQKKAFIAGIRGVATGSTNATAVFIDTNGQLGTIKSSREVKEDIQPMGSVSERLSALRPVTFRYKEASDDGTKPMQFGLIAEEVAQVFPELVVYDADGKPETVRYDVIATILLNEFQKERSTNQVEMARLRKDVAAMAAIIERLAQTRMAATTR